jgi:hypothetical protein
MDIRAFFTDHDIMKFSKLPMNKAFRKALRRMFSCSV